MKLPIAIRRLGLLLGILAALIPMGTAQEPFARASVQSDKDIFTGQRVTLVVELLAPGYFAGAPAFDLPNVAGVLLVPPRDSPTVGSEEVNGTTFTVQRHEISAFARRAGEIEIPAFTTRFAFKRQALDKTDVPASVKTTPVKFMAKAPPGAEGIGGVLSARDLTATESWKPEPGKANAGDAFVRTITFAAPDVPGMAFPPFPSPRIDGLGIYPKAPEVLDKSDRGTLLGERRDSITYLCQRPGRFLIPGARLTWFDLESGKLKTVEFPERVLEVAPNPALATSAGQLNPGKKVSVRELGIPACLTLVLAAGVWATFLFGATWLRPFRAVHLAPLNPPSSR